MCASDAPCSFLYGGCQHHNHNREFYSSVLIASHVPAGTREIPSLLGSSCLTSSHLRVLCTVSDHAMHTGCQCLGVPMTTRSITQAMGGELPQMEPVSLYLTKSSKTVSTLLLYSWRSLSGVLAAGLPLHPHTG